MSVRPLAPAHGGPWHRLKRRVQKKRRSAVKRAITRSLRRQRDDHWRIWDGTETGAGRDHAVFAAELDYLITGTPPPRMTYPWPIRDLSARPLDEPATVRIPVLGPECIADSMIPF